MIIHSPIISGSLTFAEGASATLPSSTSYSGSFLGTVNATNGIVSGSIQILGGSTVLSSSAQNFTEFSSSVASTFAGLSTDYNDLQNIPSGIISSSGQIDNLFNIDGVLSSSAQNFTEFSSSVASTFAGLSTDYNELQNIPSGIISSSAQIDDLFNIDGVVSSSEQIVSVLSSLNSYTASNDTNQSAQDTRLNQLAAATSSYLTTVDISDDTNLAVSDTAQVDMILTGDTLSANLKGGVVSGSAQVVGILSSLNTYTGSNDTTNSTQNSRLDQLSTETGSITTEQAAQDGRLSNIEGFTASLDADLATISVPANTTISTFGASLVDDADASTARTTLGLGSISTLNSIDISTNTNLAVSDTSQVDMILTGDTLSANLKGGVVSGSSQILTLVSIDEDNMASNSDTKLPTQQSVKAYVDSEVAGLVDSAPGALDTLNELAAALGDDANFSTTISNTIGGKVSQSLEIISGNGLTGGGNLTTNRTLAVGGTTDRISVSADAVDIASTYVGQTSITTLGTIGTGTWQGTAIGDSYISSATAWNAKLDSAGTIATNDYAKYDASGDLVGRSYSEVKTDLSLNNVENTAVSTWAGSSNITTLGTITTGVWNGTAIANANLANSTISGISLGSNLNTLSAGTGVTLTGGYNGSTARTISIGQAVGTGDTVQFAKVGVGGASDATYELKVTGDIGATGDIVAYISSDERLKDNIELISNPIEKVQSLKGVTWEWNDSASEAAKQSPNVGVIAQDVEKVLPQLVHDRENGFKGVDYAKLTGLLIEAIKEQQKQIDDLKSKLG